MLDWQKQSVLIMFSTALVLSLLACAMATPMSWVVHESRETAPQGYAHSGPAPADQVLSMRINLAQSNVAGLESALEAASSPSSSTFRQWLSTEEVITFDLGK